MKVYDVPLTLAIHQSDIKIKACCTIKKIPRSLYTGFVLIIGSDIIGPLVCCCIHVCHDLR